ncbi:hypothetical protein HAX54_014550, partial [Datura stramonium]|nr:hypothetical protein [Datura stramonium]
NLTSSLLSSPHLKSQYLISRQSSPICSTSSLPPGRLRRPPSPRRADCRADVSSISPTPY